MASKGAPLISQGLLLALVLTDGAVVGTPANQRELDQWIARVPMPFSGFLDSQAPQPPVQDYWSIERDHFLIIDLGNMHLVDIVASDPQAALDEVALLLQ